MNSRLHTRLPFSLLKQEESVDIVIPPREVTSSGMWREGAGDGGPHPPSRDKSGKLAKRERTLESANLCK